MWRRISYLFLAVILLAAPTGVAFSADPDPGENLPGPREAQLDTDGNLPGPGEVQEATGPAPFAVGDVINTFPNPASLAGLTFRSGSLWGASRVEDGTLYEMDADTGAVLSTLTISPLPPATFGLGFDTSRGVFVVTNTTDDVILLVDPVTGTVLASFPSPHGGPVGAAYDSTRDGYWISDWETASIDLVDPDTGGVIRTCPVPASALRIAGTGYTAAGDVILFNSRDNATSYMIQGSDCSLVASFPTPPGPDLNNGQGAAIRPADSTGYLTHYDVPTIFVVDLGLSEPVPCTLDLGLSYDGTQLVLNFDFYTGPEPVLWRNFINVLGRWIPLWSVGLPADFSYLDTISFDFPELGTVEFFTVFITGEGIVCADFETVDTGPVTEGKPPAIENLLQDLLEFEIE